MSFPTQQAFVHHGGWGDASRSHPCMKFMEEYTAVVDAKGWNQGSYDKWLASDHKLTRSTGEVVSGGEATWSFLANELYAPFASHLHSPEFAVIWEANGGWEMIGTATMYFNVAVSGQETKVKGKDGKEWDGAGPGAFHFQVKKQADGGLRVASTSIYADPTAAMVIMMKRGMLKPDDLVK